MSVRKWALPFVLALSVLGLPAVADAATIPVTITVTGAQNYGGQPAFAGSTGTAGLTVTGVTCTGLSNGSTIAPTLKALQSYTIAGATCSGGTLSKPGYVIAGYNGGGFSVFRAPLTVKADNKTKTWGEANPALSYAVSGFKNGEDAATVLTGSPALTTPATASSNVGTYPINIGQGSLSVPSNNYFLSFTAGSLEITPKPVTISVAGAQNYGGAPGFTGKTGVAGVTVSGVTCTHLSTGDPIAPTLAVGTDYQLDPASCSGGVLSSSNYAIAGYQSTSFWVFRAVLTVTADDASRVYGAANPAFGYQITGFQNGDDASVVSGAPALSTTATASSDVGSYPITPAAGTLSAGNYRFVFVPGALEVTPKQVTVAVSGAQNYGGEPGFTGKTGVAGVTVSGVTCTHLSTGDPIAPTLAVGTDYQLDPASCSGGVLSSANYAIAGYTSTSYWVFKAVLTVTADDATRTYATANPPFSYQITGFQNGDDASVVSGAPALSTTATLSSNVGTYPINAGAGSLAASNYRFVFAPGELEVTPKPVAVNVLGAQLYGGEPTFAGKTGVTGLTVTDVTCTKIANGDPIAPTLPVGTSYGVDPASCSGAVLSSPNYSVGSYKSQSFAVYKAPLSVVANDKSRTYGFANPAFDYTITGFQNGETASVVSGAPALSTEAVVQSNAGTYPINIGAGTLSAANYYFTYTTGTLTVLKKNLIVKADPATRTYGAAPPAYTATITGFRNGDTVADLTGAPAFSTPATATSDPGDYPLHVARGTLDSPNYTFIGFTSSTLTITSGVANIATTKMFGGLLTATVTYGAANTPVVGSTITFTVGTTQTVACTGVTDATGKASCTASGLNRTNIGLAGYTARFPGTEFLLPASKHQGIL